MLLNARPDKYSANLAPSQHRFQSDNNLMNNNLMNNNLSRFGSYKWLLYMNNTQAVQMSDDQRVQSAAPELFFLFSRSITILSLTGPFRIFHFDDCWLCRVNIRSCLLSSSCCVFCSEYLKRTAHERTLYSCLSTYLLYFIFNFIYSFSCPYTSCWSGV